MSLGEMLSMSNTIDRLERELELERGKVAKLREVLERIKELGQVRMSGIESGEIADKALKELGGEELESGGER